MNKKSLIAAAILIFSIFSSLFGQTPATPPQASLYADTALIIIDIQQFYFQGGQLPLVGSVEASLQAKKVLEAFRTKNMPVIHVRHVPLKPAGAVDDAAYAIHPNVAPGAGEKIIVKHYANAFRETELLDYLKQRGIKQLVICGMQTQMCVEAAVRAAADYGFKVVVPHEACATRDLKFETTTVPAAEVHAAALAAMSGTYARVVKTETLIAELR